MVLVGYDLPSSRAAVELAGRVPGAAASVGIHHNSVAETTDADFDMIAQLARAPEVVAIGETGLDYYRHYTPPQCQRRERGLRARQSRLDERQDGANGVGLGVRGDGDLTHATASGMRSNAGNTRTLLAHSRSTSASNASPTVSARHLTVARTNAGSLR